MKKILAFIVFIATLSVAYATSVSTEKPSLKASEIYLPIGKSGQLISIRDLSVIKIKDFEALTGKKMRLVDRVAFALAQKQVRKSINSDGTFNKRKVQKYFNKM